MEPNEWVVSNIASGSSILEKKLFREQLDYWSVNDLDIYVLYCTHTHVLQTHHNVPYSCNSLNKPRTWNKHITDRFGTIMSI
jgi:hypothetical protein